MTFTEKLQTAVSGSRSCLCVGLDPDLEKMPGRLLKEVRGEGAVPDGAAGDIEAVRRFLQQVIEVTAPHCAAYKPNLGFFEALGPRGMDLFEELLDLIPQEKIVIADAKRGDISSTAAHYAQAFFDRYRVDAVTLNPLMGFETLHPFLSYPGKAVYVLALTSNPGAGDFLMKPLGGYPMMAQYIAEELGRLQQDAETHIGMVVGATKSEHLRDVIDRYPGASLLIPGIGKQGGSIDALQHALANHPGIPLVNSSRGILYAGSGRPDWQQAVASRAKILKSQLMPITERYV